MAASTISIRPSTVEIAHAAAAVIPSEVSTRPLLGILGVVTGAGLVTLAGRMLSLGLADLKGHVGISLDDGAWLDSAFNASLMFIGPFTVYLGGDMRGVPRDRQYSRLLRWLFCQSAMPQRAALQ
jgi:hypothetical protein